jgi:hypothetical protein
MALTTVAELRTALGVGTLYTDAVLQSVCDASDNVLLPFLWKNQQYIIAHGNTGTVGTLYFDQDIREYFYVGQSVTISGAGTKYNGTKTITGVDTRSFNVTTTHTSDNPRHTVEPYGIAAVETYTDYTTVPAIQEASLMISIAIWQARQAPSGQGMTVDGFAPSPFTMSNTLLARVRGLLAPYLDPRSMVGYPWQRSQPFAALLQRL